MKTEIKQIDYQSARDFVLGIHYSGRMPSAVQYSFGWFVDDELKAVCIFSIPASNFVCKAICGEKYRHDVIELSRLCRTEDFPKELQLSQFVGKCLTMIGDRIVVSFSDTAMSHNGYIYQACNFLYTGATKRRRDRVSNGKHARHIDREDYYYVIRSVKHRYIYFTGNKRKRREFRKNLRFDVLPYPKGENKNYEIGFVLKQELAEKNEKESDS